MKIKGADLARAAGIKPPYLNEEIAKGNLVRDNKKLYDMDNLINRDWLVSRGGNPDNLNQVRKKHNKSKLVAQKPAQIPEKITQNLPELPEPDIDSNAGDFDIISGIPEKMLGMTIQELVLQYGGNTGLKSYVDILHKLTATHEKDLKIQVARSNLVPKEFILHLKTFVDDLMELLFDYAEKTPLEIIPLVQADPDIAKKKIPDMMIKNFSKMAQQTQRQIEREINKFEKESESV